MKANIHILSALAALGFLAACSRPDAEVLNDRVTARMTPPLPCNSQATVEYLPNGSRIMIPDTALFIIGKTDISECGQYALASVAEAMLAPRITQVAVEPGGDINSPDAYLPRERAKSVSERLSNVGFTGTQPPVVVQPAAAPSGRLWGVVLTVATGG